MIDNKLAPYGVLLLRVTLGVYFFIHWCLKVFVFTPAGFVQFFGSLGLPPALAYFTMAIELIGALALITGFYARVAAIVLIPILVGAIVTVHGSAGFFFNNPNGGWEYPAFWSVMLLVLAMLGDGALALRSFPAKSSGPASYGNA